MRQKKKKAIRIVDKSSVNYTFINDNLVYNQPSKIKKGDSSEGSQKTTKRSIVDIKNQNRHKINSKKIRSLQGHSPVYE